MDWLSALPIIAVVTIVPVVTAWVMREGELSFWVNPEIHCDQKFARPSRSQVITAWLLAGCAMVIVISMCVIAVLQGQNFDEPMALVFLALFFGGLSWLAFRSLTCWYVWDDEVLASGAQFSRKRMFAWSDMNSAKWSTVWQCFILDFGDDGQLWIQKMGLGTGRLIEDAQRFLAKRC